MNKEMNISDDVKVFITEEKGNLVMALGVQKGLREMRATYLIDEEIIKLRDFLNSEVKGLEE